MNIFSRVIVGREDSGEFLVVEGILGLFSYFERILRFVFSLVVGVVVLVVRVEFVVLIFFVGVEVFSVAVFVRFCGEGVLVGTVKFGYFYFILV